MSPGSKNLTGAVLCALAGVLFWVFVMPSYSMIGQTQTAVSERQALLDDRTKTIASIEEIVKEYQKREQEVARLSSVVPAKKSAAEVVSAIQDIAGRTGLQLVSLGLADQKADQNIPYNTLNIDISLSGSYLSLVSFLETLEKNIRLMDVVSIDATQSAGGGNLGFRVRVNAYYLK
ncbi:MAG TPA: type 4a pilus biogenesis protein PilO [Candidatus Paceibacterota bacterium]